MDSVEVRHEAGIRVAWFSPDYTHHSRAKGGRRLERRWRGRTAPGLRARDLAGSQSIRTEQLHVRGISRGNVVPQNAKRHQQNDGHAATTRGVVRRQPAGYRRDSVNFRPHPCSQPAGPFARQGGLGIRQPIPDIKALLPQRRAQSGASSMPTSLRRLRRLCMLAAQRAPILPIPILKVRCCRQVSVSRMDLVAVGGTRVNAVHSRDRSLTQGKLRRVGSHIRRDPEQAANAKSGLRERNRLT